MERIFPFFVTAFFALSTLFAQAPTIEWQKTIGGNSFDELACLKQTADGSYILGGTSYSGISGVKTENKMGGSDYWVVKLDAVGNIQWQNTIGGSQDDYLQSLEQTTDGGYILGGDSYSGISGDKTENSINNSSDYWVVKIGASGNIQWQNTIGGSSNEQFHAIRQTSDGGYILGGTSFSGASGDKTEAGSGDGDYWVVKINASGNIQWQNTIGGTADDKLWSVEQTTDGGYILGGNSISNVSGDKMENSMNMFPPPAIQYPDYWVVKLDGLGNIQWQNTIGGQYSDNLQNIHQTADGGYILSGDSWSGISGDKTDNNCTPKEDIWVIKLDAVGNIQWQNDIGTYESDYVGSIEQTSDGGYFLSGFSRAYGPACDKAEYNWGESGDYWPIKLDAAGNVEWEKIIGGTQDDDPTTAQQTADGGYIIGGWSISNISGDKTKNSFGADDYWIIKLSPVSVPTVMPSPAQKVLEIYPNPTTGAAFVHADVPTLTSLRNGIGQTISTQTLQNGDKIDLSSQPDGLYFLVETGTGQVHKILKNK